MCRAVAMLPPLRGPSIPARSAPPCRNEAGLRLEIHADDVIYALSQAGCHGILGEHR